MSLGEAVQLLRELAAILWDEGEEDLAVALDRVLAQQP